MKMTRKEVIELLQNMNEDCSNVEFKDGCGFWMPSTADKVEFALENILHGYIYRIKDNSLKEVTPALRGKWVISKDDRDEYMITGLDYERQWICIHERWFNVKEFNAEWQLVED